VLIAWLEAASSFDASDDPAEALTSYIGAKMDLARTMPLGSRIWASEIMRGAPVIQDFLDTTLTRWVHSRGAVVRHWIAEGKLKPIEPKFLFYMIWATTQHYADFSTQVEAITERTLHHPGFFAAARQSILDAVLGPEPG